MGSVKRGVAVHLHHNALFAWCDNFDVIVEHIKSDEPENARETRLRLFKLLSDAEVALLPEQYVAALKNVGAARENVGAASKKVGAARENVGAASKKYIAAWKKYVAASKKYIAALKKVGAARKKFALELEVAHKQICGCVEWNGRQIVFR